MKRLFYTVLCYCLLFPTLGFSLSLENSPDDSVGSLLGDIDKTVTSATKILILSIILGPLAVILFFASVSGVKAYNRAKNDQVENPSSAALIAFGKTFVITMILYILGTVFANKVFFQGKLFTLFITIIESYLGIQL